MVGDLEAHRPQEMVEQEHATADGQLRPEPVVEILDAYDDLADTVTRQEAPNLDVLGEDCDAVDAHVSQAAGQVVLGQDAVGDQGEEGARVGEATGALSSDPGESEENAPSARADGPGTPPTEPPDGPPIPMPDGDDSGEGEGDASESVPLAVADVTRFNEHPWPEGSEAAGDRLYNVIESANARIDLPEETFVVDDGGQTIAVASSRIVADVPEAEGYKAHIDLGEDTIGLFFAGPDGQESDYHVFAWDEAQKAVVRTDIDLNVVLGHEGGDHMPASTEEVFARQMASYRDYISKTSGQASDEVPYPSARQSIVGERQMEFVAGLVENGSAFAVTFNHLADLAFTRASQPSATWPGPNESRACLPEFWEMLRAHRAADSRDVSTHKEPAGTVDVSLGITEPIIGLVRVDLTQSYDQLDPVDQRMVASRMGESADTALLSRELSVVRRLSYTDTEGVLHVHVDGFLKFTGSDEPLVRFPGQAVTGNRRDTAYLRQFLANPHIATPPRRRPRG